MLCGGGLARRVQVRDDSVRSGRRRYLRAARCARRGRGRTSVNALRDAAVPPSRSGIPRRAASSKRASCCAPVPVPPVHQPRPSSALSRRVETGQGKGPNDIDLVVVRRISEDLATSGQRASRRNSGRVAIQTSINTRSGVEPCLRLRLQAGLPPRRVAAVRGLALPTNSNAAMGRASPLISPNNSS